MTITSDLYIGLLYRDSAWCVMVSPIAGCDINDIKWHTSHIVTSRLAYHRRV